MRALFKEIGATEIAALQHKAERPVAFGDQHRERARPRRDRHVVVLLGYARARAGGIEGPAVIGADDLALLEPALRQARRAMRAFVDGAAERTVGAAPDNVVIAEQPDRTGLVGYVGGIGDRVPEFLEGRDFAHKHGILLFSIVTDVVIATPS